ncbi:hypothetical protein OAB57_00085 [Bacteriovoracaceae bacterium]|nr:hypothetical protein [Bacteriovoracaceae bacterium]
MKSTIFIFCFTATICFANKGSTYNMTLYFLKTESKGRFDLTTTTEKRVESHSVEGFYEAIAKKISDYRVDEPNEVPNVAFDNWILPDKRVQLKESVLGSVSCGDNKILTKEITSNYNNPIDLFRKLSLAQDECRFRGQTPKVTLNQELRIPNGLKEILTHFSDIVISENTEDDKQSVHCDQQNFEQNFLKGILKELPHTRKNSVIGKLASKNSDIVIGRQ